MSTPPESEPSEWVRQSAQRTRNVFTADLGIPEQSSTISFRLHSEYAHVKELPPRLAAMQAITNLDRRKIQQRTVEPPGTGIPSTAVESPNAQSRSLIRNSIRQDKPVWHRPWKLTRVLKSHSGWVRAIAVDPSNEWFASGAGDGTIKFWDMASGKLKTTLPGHISTVRGLDVSPRHPLLFSCGEDKKVKCWDLERNQSIREYHGHRGGVYTLALHPTIDVLCSAGHDRVVRVWDIRTRGAICTLDGHIEAVTDVKCQEVDPQVLSASLDGSVRVWDLRAGKATHVLTHHKAGVRALAIHPEEFTFASASTDQIKQWKCPESTLMQNFQGHKGSINTLSIDKDNVMFSGGDDGLLTFWDWKTGQKFLQQKNKPYPGSLAAEAGGFCSAFDKTGMQLIIGCADTSLKVYKEDAIAAPECSLH
ncbi:WD40 repeat-like protein, partial [Aureobasidium melanogenum]